MSKRWTNCLTILEGEISSQDFNTWLRPLQVIELNEQFRLLAPNKFVFDWVKENYLSRIEQILIDEDSNPSLTILLEIGTKSNKEKNKKYNFKTKFKGVNSKKF